MKTTFYILSVILPLIFSSCSNNDNLDENNFSPSSLIFKITITTNSENSDVLKSLQTVNVDTIFRFSGENIAWFNETTGELKFNDNYSEFEMIGNGSVGLHVYSGDNALYSINLMLTYDIMSWRIDEPVIIKHTGENTFYLKNGYPERNLDELDHNSPLSIEREKNWNVLVQSEGWRLFISKLKEEGRYRQ